LQWQHERRLVFVASPTWLGWFCERCCWNIKLGTAPSDHSIDAQQRFDAHDCEQFASENWKRIE